jgi:enamine deaminase RidA (YjgF/YER057c/UK114 family)
MNVREKLAELGIALPVLPEKELPFAAGVLSDSLVFLSGQTPTVNGVPEYVGTVGSTVSIEEARRAAEVCTLNLLAALEKLIGDLNKVKRVVKLNGYVACGQDFRDQPLVINAASELLNKIFGEKHARAAIGVSALPGGVCVEIEMIVELEK